MPGEQRVEDRLRELLREPGWSLPAWPDAEARVRRAARRQRIRAATAGAAVAGIAAAVVATLTGFQPPGAYSAPPVAQALPGVGAAGFPVSIYPAAVRGVTGGRFSRCPDPDGLDAPGPAARGAAAAVVATLDSARFSTGLRVSDRAYWPQERAAQQAAAGSTASRGRVLYSGALATAAGPGTAGVASLRRAIRISCGDRIVRDSWLVVTAAPHRQAAPSEFLLLDRRGHLLVWSAS